MQNKCKYVVVDSLISPSVQQTSRPLVLKLSHIHSPFLWREFSICALYCSQSQSFYNSAFSFYKVLITAGWDRGGMIWEDCWIQTWPAVCLEHQSPIRVLTGLVVTYLQWSDQALATTLPCATNDACHVELIDTQISWELPHYMP